MNTQTHVLTPALLLRGYANGVFPMAEHRDDPEIFWVDPRCRGILPLDGFQISRSLARRMRRNAYQVHTDRDFAGVVDACADRVETWINAEIRALYIELHRIGAAHSIEIWDQETLVGGVYGVVLGGAFFGESMFSRRTDTSKIALAYLVSHLNRCGFTLLDTQFLTPHLESLGGIEVSRTKYHQKLEMALEQNADFSQYAIETTPHSTLQRNTHTS